MAMHNRPRERIVTQYLTRVGVDKRRKWAAFEHSMRRKHGKAFEAFVQAVQARANGGGADVYSLKNQSLELSLGICAQYDLEYSSAYLVWLLGAPIGDPSSVLDVGCDNGIAACFYAVTWPGAQILGIDSNQHAVARARELAHKLGLSNARFERADLCDGVSRWGSFDLITANRVLHEAFTHNGRAAAAFLADDMRCWDLTEIHARSEDEPLREWLKDAARALSTPDAQLVAANRLPNPASVWWWMQLVESAGLWVSLDRSYVLEATGAIDEKEAFPMTVARRGRSTDIAKTAHDALSLFGYPKFVSKNLKFEDDAAEAMFKSIGPKTLLARVELKYLDGSGIQRIELWAAPTISCVYDYTNRWYRRLSLVPRVATFEHFGAILQSAEAASASVEIALDITEDCKRLAAYLDSPIAFEERETAVLA